MKLKQLKVCIIFVIVFIHNTVLDLFLLTDGAKPLFLWEKSMEVATITVHFIIALSVALVYAISMKCREQYVKSGWQVSDMTWALCSVSLLFSILFMVF